TDGLVEALDERRDRLGDSRVISHVSRLRQRPMEETLTAMYAVVAVYSAGAAATDDRNVLPVKACDRARSLTIYSTTATPRVTYPLLDKALTPPLPERVVFLVQEEVANRITARLGTKAYGALTVGVQALCRAEKLFVVRAGAFEPPPKVQSALLRLVPLAEPLAGAAPAGPAFRRFVTACFS